MIQALQTNSQVAFKGNNNQEPKTGAKQVFHTARDLTLNTVKNINTVTGTTAGVARGVAEGTAAAVTIGILGKNIKNSKGQIAGTLTGIAKDLGKVGVKALKAIPSLITKAPLENAKNALSLPSKFCKNYLKGNKLTALFAATAAAGILALRTLQGKMNANIKNCDIDHRTNTAHAKV